MSTALLAANIEDWHTKDELQAFIDEVKAEIAAKDQEKELKKVQASIGTSTQVLAETGPGPAQTPPVVQNEPKPDEAFIKLQKKLQEDGELLYKKIKTIWTLCRYGKKRGQIALEIKDLYKEPDQKLVKEVIDIYEKSGASEEALQKLLKDLPIPAEFVQKTEKIQEKVSIEDQKKAATTPQNPNSNTNSPPDSNSHFNQDFSVNFDSILSGTFAQSLVTPPSPLDDFMKTQNRNIALIDRLFSSMTL